MRYLSFLALALAIAITTALVGASGEQDPQHVSDGPPRFAVIHAVEPTTTSTLAYVLDSWVGVDYDEVQELAATIRSVVGRRSWRYGAFGCVIPPRCVPGTLAGIGGRPDPPPDFEPRVRAVPKHGKTSDPSDYGP